MIPFRYTRSDAPEAALHAGSAPGAYFLGGGTNLVDLMKYGVEAPAELIDVNHTGLDQVRAGSDGAHIGASVRNSDLANQPDIVAHFPLLSFAILSGASPQLRNLATTAGNLMQRTRCPYFTNIDFPSCNKRKPGSGCGAVDGYNRNLAILGQTDRGASNPATCIATNPGDMSVALYALDATVEVRSAKGSRSIPVRSFHRLPGSDPARDTELRPGEMITAVTLPAAKFARNSWYLKARDRHSYAFALVSVAAGLEMDGNTIRSASVALGGVAHKPWHSPEADAALAGKPATPELFTRVAEILLRGSKGYPQNSFKIELAKSCVVRALSQAAQGGQA